MKIILTWLGVLFLVPGFVLGKDGDKPKTLDFSGEKEAVRTLTEAEWREITDQTEEFSLNLAYTNSIYDELKKINPQPFVSAVNLSDCPLITTEAVLELKGCVNLKKLTLNRTNIIGFSAEFVEALPKLEKVELSGTLVGTGTVEALASLKDLKSLDLSWTLADDNALEAVNEIESLEELNVAHTIISDQGAKNLGNLTALRILDLSGTGVTDEGIGKLPKAGNLRELSLASVEISDVGVEVLTQYPKLRTLNLANTGITDKSLKTLRKLKNLKSLNLENCHFLTEKGIAKLQKALPKCEILTTKQVEVAVSEGKKTEKKTEKELLVLNFLRQEKDKMETPPRKLERWDWEKIRGMEEPFELQLDWNALTLAEFQELATLPNLRRLRLDWTQPPLILIQKATTARSNRPSFRRPTVVRPPRAGVPMVNRPTPPAPPSVPHFSPFSRQMAYIQKEKNDPNKPHQLLPQFAFLVHQVVERDESMALLKFFPNLESLEITLCMMTPGAASHFASLEQIASLKDLRLTLDGVEDREVECFQNLENITVLNMKGSNGLTDDGLRYFAGMKRLRELRLHSGSMSAEGLDFLDELTELEVLRIPAKVATEELCEKIGKLENLRELLLVGGNYSAKGIWHLRNLEKLEFLDISGNTVVSDMDLQALEGLSALKTLNVTRCIRLTDESLLSIAKLKNLERVDLRYCDGISANGVKKLQEALPNCKIEASIRSSASIPPVGIPPMNPSPMNGTQTPGNMPSTPGNTPPKMERRGFPEPKESVKVKKAEDNAFFAEFAELKGTPMFYCANDWDFRFLSPQDFATILAKEKGDFAADFAKIDLTLFHAEVLLNHPQLIAADMSEMKSFNDFFIRRCDNFGQNLIVLNLSGTTVTERSVDTLKKLTKLKKLDISGTRIPSEKAQELREALPNCEIVAD
ncbi:MAG: hypothetical protein Q4C70_02025 [Planctomycetia bacterium]|nr:hypothetical protein [Planctomycetia bacterium]